MSKINAIGFAGYSGSGKTSLIEQVIPLLTQRGLKVSVLKHAHHNFDIDVPGKDSYRHREAGAQEVVLSSARRWVVMHENLDQAEPSMQQMLTRLAPCDLVIVEGYKREVIPKIEVYRQAFAQAQPAAKGRDPLFLADGNIVAVATDAPAQIYQQAQTQSASGKPLRVLDLNDPAEVAAFIGGFFGLFEETLLA